MTSPMVIEKDLIIDTLATISGIPVLVQEGSNLKIFWKHVDDDVVVPYIVLYHMTGGQDKLHPYSDSIWKVVGVTADMTKADDFSNAIHELVGLWPVITSHPTVCPAAPLEEIMPIFDRYTVQNVPFFEVGGMYRIRTNLE